jgi:vacuolar-type H+-ATPase subunit E/Vma4
MVTDAAFAAALAPVRGALLTAAKADAERTRARSESAAQQTVASAVAFAARLRGEARAQASADAAAALTAERAQVGRRARAVVLRAHRDDYEALRAAGRAALAVLREDADYPRLRQRMTEVVIDLLGTDAEVREADSGGVIGEIGGRRVDCSIGHFVDRAVDEVVAALDPTAANGGRAT